VLPPAGTAAGIPNCPQCLLGVPLHPSFLYEIGFLLLLLLGVYRLRGRLAVEGDLFKLFLLSYGLFRFLVEFVRGNEVLLLGLTGTQVFLIVSLPLLIGYFGSQIRRGVYRQTRPVVGVPA
jgi:prolipoprotein diacylglyceryltransferase